MTTNSSNNSTTYASFGQRLMASLSDQLILNLIPMFALLYLFTATQMVDLFTKLILIVTLVVIPSIVFGAVYHAWFLSQFGATPGKQIWGVKIVDDQDQNLSFNLAFIREFLMKQISRFALGLGFLWMIKQPEKRTWHDLLIGSKAINNNPSLSISWTLFILLIIGNGAIILSLVRQLPSLVELFV